MSKDNLHDKKKIIQKNSFLSVFHSKILSVSSGIVTEQQAPFLPNMEHWSVRKGTPSHHWIDWSWWPNDVNQRCICVFLCISCILCKSDWWLWPNDANKRWHSWKQKISLCKVCGKCFNPRIFPSRARYSLEIIIRSIRNTFEKCCLWLITVGDRTSDQMMSSGWRRLVVEQKETNDWNSVHFVGGSGLVPVHKSRWDQDRSRWWNENHMIERRQKETEAWNFVASVIVNQHRETSGSALQSKKWLLRDRLAFGEFWHLPVASCIVNLVRGERELADQGTAWTNLSSASLSTKLFSFLGCTFTTFMFLSKSKKNNKTNF